MGVHTGGRENGDAVRIHFPPDLPVSARRDDIAQAIRDHQVVIVAGETGSGKTTQLPEDLPRPRVAATRQPPVAR